MLDREPLRFSELRADVGGHSSDTRGRGVLYLYGNYGGDKLNFELAGELAESEGIAVRSVRWADDVDPLRQTRRAAGEALPA